MPDKSELFFLGAIALCLFIQGVFLWFGKGAWMIAGYNTLPRRERERIDKRKLCRTAAVFLFYLVAIVLVDLFTSPCGYVIGLGLPIGAIVLLVYCNTGDRMKKE